MRLQARHTAKARLPDGQKREHMLNSQIILPACRVALRTARRQFSVAHYGHLTAWQSQTRHVVHYPLRAAETQRHIIRVVAARITMGFDFEQCVVMALDQGCTLPNGRSGLAVDCLPLVVKINI